MSYLTATEFLQQAYGVEDALEALSLPATVNEAVAASSSPAVTLANPQPLGSLLVGSPVVIDVNLPTEESVVVTAVNVSGGTVTGFTATFLRAHAASAAVSFVDLRQIQKRLDTAARLIDAAVGYPLGFQQWRDEAHDTYEGIQFDPIRQPVRAVQKMDILGTWGLAVGQRMDYPLAVWPVEAVTPPQQPVVFGVVFVDRTNGIIRAILPIPASLMTYEAGFMQAVENASSVLATYTTGYDIPIVTVATGAVAAPGLATVPLAVPVPLAQFELAIPATSTYAQQFSISLITIDPGLPTEETVAVSSYHVTTGNLVDSVTAMFQYAHVNGATIWILPPDELSIPVPDWLKEINRVAATELLQAEARAAYVPAGMTSTRSGMVGYTVDQKLTTTSGLGAQPLAILERNLEDWSVA